MSLSLNIHLELLTERIPFHLAELSVISDPLLFALLGSGEVPNPPIAPRGLPERFAPHTLGALALYVADSPAQLEQPRFVSAVEAQRAVARGASRWLDASRTMVSDPDIVAASWLDLDELEQIQARYIQDSTQPGRPSGDLGAAIAVLRFWENYSAQWWRSPGRGRMVYWLK